MNYYERYCGDYQRDTADLSLMEHGVYTMLLDTYYSNEKPLDFDAKSLYRICRAMNKKERDAVDKIAARFFPISEVDGLRHNARADEVIACALKRISASKNNGKNGGRPKKENPEKTQQVSEEKPGGFHLANPAETQPGITRPQTPDPNKNPIASAVCNSDTEANSAMPLVGFAMRLDWRPPDDLLIATCTRNGVLPGIVTQAALADFTAYWSAKPDHHVDGVWTQKLVNSARRFAVKNPTATQSDPDDKRSAYEILRGGLAEGSDA